MRSWEEVGALLDTGASFIDRSWIILGPKCARLCSEAETYGVQGLSCCS